VAIVPRGRPILGLSSGCRFREGSFVDPVEGAPTRPAKPEVTTVRYLLLIYTPEVDPASVTPEQVAATSAQYAVFTREVREREAMQGGEALQPTTTATTVRVRDGKTLVTDGPYAETKEALGGFYLLDVQDLDEALELAAKIPGAQWGAIEVRPIWEQGG
jgi:hypothetical protein